MLKDMGRSKSKKKFGRYIICKSCGEKIFIDSEEVRESSTKIGGVIIYECGCSNEIIID